MESEGLFLVQHMDTSSEMVLRVGPVAEWFLWHQLAPRDSHSLGCDWTCVVLQMIGRCLMEKRLNQQVLTKEAQHV